MTAHRISFGAGFDGTPMKGTYTFTLDVYIPHNNSDFSTFRGVIWNIWSSTTLATNCDIEGFIALFL